MTIYIGIGSLQATISTTISLSLSLSSILVFSHTFLIPHPNDLCSSSHFVTSIRRSYHDAQFLILLATVIFVYHVDSCPLLNARVSPPSSLPQLYIAYMRHLNP
eukprot:1099300_1